MAGGEGESVPSSDKNDGTFVTSHSSEPLVLKSQEEDEVVSHPIPPLQNGIGLKAGAAGTIQTPAQFIVGSTNSSTGEDSSVQKDELCGLGPCWLPRCLQRFRSPKWFLFFLCWAGFLQGFIVNGSVNVVITTLERRFQLSSTESGLIAGGYDIASFLCLIPVSYFGASRNKPRFIGAGVLVLSLGAFVFSLPHFLAGPYAFSREQEDICSSAARGCPTLGANNYTSDVNRFKWVLLLGQLLHGAGAAPFYTLGCTYLDENVPTKMSSLYLGIYYTMAIIGPACGYLTGGTLLQIYTDLSVDPASLGLTPASSVWVGAWWIGFVLSALIGILVALPVLTFPKTLPGYTKVQSQKVSEMHKKLQDSEVVQTGFGVKIRDLPRSLKFLMTNPTFVFLSLAGATEGMLVSGLATFLPKVIESQFSVNSSWAAVRVGVATIIGAGGGTFLGGYLVKKLNLKCANIIKLCVASTFVCVGLTFVFLAHCPEPSFMGLNTHHPSNWTTDQRENPSQFLAECNKACGCSDFQYNPICGTDNVIYYSPCYAGCQEVHHYKNSKVYSNCSCIEDPGKNLTLFDGSVITIQATREKCSNDCNMDIHVFLLVISLSMFFTFLVSMPSLSATLRCVAESQKSFALGIQWLTVRILGTIPAPLIFGSLIDLSCILWQEPCDGSSGGACLAFDNRSMSTNVLSIVAVVKFLSFAFFLGGWLCYRPPKKNVQLVATTDSLRNRGDDSLTPSKIANGSVIT